MKNEIEVTKAPEFQFSMDEFVDWLEDLDPDEIIYAHRGMSPLYAYLDDALEEDELLIVYDNFAYILTEDQDKPIWVLRGEAFPVLSRIARCDDFPETAGEWLAALKKEGLA